MIRTAVTWGPAALWAAVLFLLSASPDVPGASWLDVVPFADKLGHLGLYAVLGATLAWGRLRSVGRPSRPADGLLIALGALYGVTDEWHQTFVPGRDASAADWLADVVGVTLGYLLVRRLTAAADTHLTDSSA